MINYLQHDRIAEVDMVKLHFLEDEDEDEGIVQLRAPKLNKFKPRKLKRNFDHTLGANTTTATATTSNHSFLSTSLLFDDNEETLEYSDLNLPRNNLANKIKKKTIPVSKQVTSVEHGQRPAETVNRTSQQRNVKDYLRAYEDPTTASAFALSDLKEGIEEEIQEMQNGDTNQESATIKDTDETVEGFLLTGSDLDDVSDVDMLLPEELPIAKNKSILSSAFLESQQELEALVSPEDKKENAKRRKEIVDALSRTNLSEKDDLANSSIDETAGDGDRCQTVDLHTEVIALSSEDPDNIDLEESVPPKRRKTQLVFHPAVSFEEQLQLTKDKLTSLSDIVSKRELQANHLRAELKTLTDKTKQYAEQMSQALCHCR